MAFVSRILSDAGLERPDGRPLYNYPCSLETQAGLEEYLDQYVASGRQIETVAPDFVFWATEHIRARFPGGSLNWAFVLGRLGLPEDDQILGRRLAECGLSWWRRPVRKSEAGDRLFLYSLMAEGGIPEGLVKEPGLYRDVVVGVLAEIEAEGGADVEPWALQIAARWIERLPQAFQNPDIVRLMASLALSLANLRSKLPDDLPEAAAVQWLDMHRPDWVSTIPLRMSPQVAKSLIRPALEAERGMRSVAGGPLCRRELRRDPTGIWRGYLAFHDDGWLPAGLFPDVESLRLRLLPTASESIKGVIYNATPEDSGYRLRRVGASVRNAFRFSLDDTFALAAFADGQAKGQAVIDAGISPPSEEISFWRAADRNEGPEATCLIPLPGGGRTRGPCLWFLGPDDMEPEADTGVSLDEIETAPGGFLWRISGTGVLRFGGKRYRIETGASEESIEARLFAFGKTLRGWRLDGDVPAYHGEVTIHGQMGAGAHRGVGERELRRIEGRSLGGELVEWRRDDETVARLRFIRLPGSATLDLREESAGCAVFTAEGFDAGWRVRLRAGDIETTGDLNRGTIRLTLETPGATPGLVYLRLSEPETGRSLELRAAWPARTGMILNPGGNRLTENQPISVEALYGWHTVAPNDVRGDLQLQLAGYRAISLPAPGEVSLANAIPLIKTMLAQEGPDAQINLSLIVSAQETRRLEIRRYHDQSIVEKEILHMGLDRDHPVVPETVLAVELNKKRRATLHAVDTDGLTQVGPIDVDASVDLREYLKDGKGPWLIQSRLEGRIQRAAIWNSRVGRKTTREGRIAAHTEEWRQLISTRHGPDWDRSWQLIQAAQQVGDASSLDQVQALANTPTAAIRLALRVSPKEISNVLALESTIPIFWPALEISNFTEAVMAERARQQEKLAQHTDEDESEMMADASLVKRIEKIRMLRPELSGHLLKALVDSGVFDRTTRIPDRRDTLEPFLIPDPGKRLLRAVQDAARRFDRLPQGVGGLEPCCRPAFLPSFNTYTQSMIDAPLVVAEMATGLRSAPGVSERLVLINLRSVDHLYFDTALPAALHLYLTDSGR